MPPHHHPSHVHDHRHGHSHAPGERHPHAEISPSLLRLSAIERLAIAGLLALVLWAAVFWAVGWKV